MSRRFDSKTNIFDPSGRIRQVENALEAVNHGSLVIGIKCSDGVLLCAERGDQSKLLESQQEKIYKIDSHVVTGVVGVNSDGNTLVTRTRHQAQAHLKTFSSPITTEKLVNYVAQLKHVYTQYGGMRPFGVAMLIAGYDAATSEYQLFQTDPAGNYDAWVATCIGKSEEVKVGKDILKQELSREGEGEVASLPNLDEAVRLAIKVLAKVKELNLEYGEKLEMATLSDDGSRPVIKIFNTHEITEQLVKHQELFEKEDEDEE